MRGGYKYRWCASILRRNGWEDCGCGRGGHRKFKKDGRHISIPDGRQVSIMMFNRLCKENGIRTNV